MSSVAAERGLSLQNRIKSGSAATPCNSLYFNYAEASPRLMFTQIIFDCCVCVSATPAGGNKENHLFLAVLL